MTELPSCYSAYMLAAGAFGPMYGKLSNMFGTHLTTMDVGFFNQIAGRKPILYSSICTFLVRVLFSPPILSPESVIRLDPHWLARRNP